MKKATKIIAIFLAIIVMVSVLTACPANTKIPDGTYVCKELNNMTVVIKGNNFSMNSGLFPVTLKYTYDKKTGAITVTDGAAGLPMFDYKDGVLRGTMGDAVFNFVKQ